MVILSTKLTTEQVTLIVRAIVQALSYGVPFLLGYLILWNVPKVAPLETHDLLNRVVGQSTSFFASCRWIFRRLFRENKDGDKGSVSSMPLLYVLTLSLCFGWFVSISDLGILGINSCTVPVIATFQDFPASVKSDKDALDLVTSNMLKGTDPSTVRAYRCEASVGVTTDNPQVNLTVCSQWSNSTYGDPSHFSFLNSTDSDVLMPSNNFAHDYLDDDGSSGMNMYFLGASKNLVTEPTIRSGVAVFPHEVGLRLIVGVPNLSKNQQVVIPKTLGLEVEIGCMPLGVFGQEESDFITGQEYLIPDDIYLSERLNNYTGPAYFQAPLAKAADALRQEITTPFFNTSTTSSNGFYPSYLGGGGFFSPSTEVVTWTPPGVNISADMNMTNFYLNFISFMEECMIDIYNLVNVTTIPYDMQSTPSFCEFYQIRGSSLHNQVPVLAHASMICATTTQVNMLSATLEVDDAGTLTYDFTRLPSAINVVPANVVSGNTTPAYVENIWRYTLSDDPAGATQHYIYQERAASSTVVFEFMRGTGIVGSAFAQVGSAMLLYGTFDIGSLGVINADYFSSNFSTQEVTTWASSLGASYLLSSVGYNGWAARASPGFTVVSTEKGSATCYNLQYATAFFPLFAGSLMVLIWSFRMLFTSKIREARKMEELYGGLPTVIKLKQQERLSSGTLLEWEDNPEPHLKEVNDGSDVESQKLMSHSETETETETEGYPRCSVVAEDVDARG